MAKLKTPLSAFLTDPDFHVRRLVKILLNKNLKLPEIRSISQSGGVFGLFFLDRQALCLSPCIRINVDGYLSWKFYLSTHDFNFETNNEEIFFKMVGNLFLKG